MDRFDYSIGFGGNPYASNSSRNNHYKTSIDIKTYETTTASIQTPSTKTSQSLAKRAIKSKVYLNCSLYSYYNS